MGNPDQPRDPKGTPTGGQWTSATEVRSGSVTVVKGDWAVDPSGVAASLNEAEASTAAHKARWLAAARRVLRPGDTVRSGRRIWTLTRVGDDLFWVSDRGRGVADSAALEEFGEPYKALIASRDPRMKGA